VSVEDHAGGDHGSDGRDVDPGRQPDHAGAVARGSSGARGPRFELGRARRGRPRDGGLEPVPRFGVRNRSEE